MGRGGFGKIKIKKKNFYFFLTYTLIESYIRREKEKNLYFYREKKL
jgi:hypothetical protein